MAPPKKPNGPMVRRMIQLEPSDVERLARVTERLGEGSDASTIRRLIRLADAEESRLTDPACGLNTQEPFAHYDHALSLWKTSQVCLSGDCLPFSETWPKWGLMRNGQCYLHAPSVHHIHESGCSLWPTPTASMDGRGFGIPLHERSGRYKKSTILRVHALVKEHGWRIHPNFTEALMALPTGWTEITPSATASTGRSPNSSVKRSSKRRE